jgi:Mrp family chromosome partitioning ATPase
LLALAPARDGRPTDRETAEWFERICASGLLRRVADGGVLLVTSPSGGEGKSTVAANVAGCLARGGADVLLMRMSPGDVQARRRELGLVDVAAGTCLLDEAVLWYGDDAPSVLPLGGSRESAVRRDAFLSGAALRSVIHDCRRDFHTVVIDAPSVLAAPALRVLGRRVDAVLMVVEWGKTDAALVDEAMECFEPRKVGVVVNKVDLERYEGSAPLDGNSAQGPAALMRATPVARRRGATPPGSAGSRARTRRPRNVVDREN